MLRESRRRPGPAKSLRHDARQAELAALNVSPKDWLVIVTARPNVLVEGPERSTELLIQALAAEVNEPTYEWNLPWPKNGGAIVIVRAVDTLNDTEQRQLLDRLNASSGDKFPLRQVIAASARPLFPLIQQGLFREDLYYRLNVVHLEIGEAP